MVQIIENWSDVTGRIAAILSVGDVRDHTLIKLRVDSVSNVDDFPNLLEGAIEQVIEVALPNASLAGVDLTVGARLRCRIRKATPHRHFAHPQHISSVPS